MLNSSLNAAESSWSRSRLVVDKAKHSVSDGIGSIGNARCTTSERRCNATPGSTDAKIHTHAARENTAPNAQSPANSTGSRTVACATFVAIRAPARRTAPSTPAHVRNATVAGASRWTSKSRAGRRRSFVLPDELYDLLIRHEEVQLRERAHAGTAWEEGGWMFTQPNSRPIDARLHDARHTGATVLLLLGVHERVVMEVMGWSTELNGYFWKAE